MARVSIEERAAAAAKKLARIMGWNKYETLGRLYTLWHDSQELEQTQCTLGDISTWLDLTADEEKTILDGLIESGFIRDLPGEDSFEIVGNAKHIENLTQRREASRKNGKLGGRPSKSLSNNLEKPSRKPRPNPTENLLCSSLQFSATQEQENTIAQSVPDRANSNLNLGIVYQLYPRKIGKQQGMKKCKLEIKSEEDLELVLKAVRKYSKYCAEQKLEPKFIKHFGTFMSSWRDWLDDDVGNTTIPKPVSLFANFSGARDDY